LDGRNFKEELGASQEEQREVKKDEEAETSGRVECALNEVQQTKTCVCRYKVSKYKYVIL
jgi:hypothetical protein